MAPLQKAFPLPSRSCRRLVWTRPPALDAQVRTCNGRRAETIGPSDAGYAADRQSERPGAEAIFHYYGSAVYPPGQSFTTFSQAGLVTLPNPNVGSYNLLNLRAGYRFWHDKAEVALSAFNSLNDRHQEYPLGETIGSRVMGWLTVRF